MWIVAWITSLFFSGVAFYLSNRASGDVGEVQQRLALLEGRMMRLPPDALTQPAEPPPAPPLPEEPLAMWEAAAPPGAEVPEPAAPAPPPRPSPRAAPPSRLEAEGLLTERGLVWLGGITLALGGAFLVKFSMEQGLLSPAIRVAMGILIGVAAIALGHHLSRRESGSDATPWLLPPVLVGSGCAIAFASLFAAHGLYDLLPAPLAFAALAGAAAGTALLSVHHGPHVAALGIVGAFVVPALIRSQAPDAVGLFTYLSLVTAGAAALLRWREWWWLAWVTVAGALGWALLWLVSAFAPGDELVLGLHVCTVLAIVAAVRRGIRPLPPFAAPADTPMVRHLVLVTAVTASLTLFLMVAAADRSPVALAFLFAHSIGVIAFAWRDQPFDRLPWVAAATMALVLAGWDLSGAAIGHVDVLLTPPLPLKAERFLWTAALAAMLFGGAGLRLAARAERPQRWAALAAATPVILLGEGYWRLSPLGLQWAWWVGALALAGLLVAAAERAYRRRADRRFEAALGIYATGAVAAIALGLVMALDEAWLTVGLSLALLGVGWVQAHLEVPGLRRVALGLTGVVLVRLLLNPYVLDYPLAEPSLFNWLLYGYGVPAASFAVAARLFRTRADDHLVATLEAGAIAFAVLLAGFEIRHLAAGGLLPSHGYGFAERSLHDITWLAGAAALFALHRRTGRPVPLWGGVALLMAATPQIVLGQLLLGNPLFTGAPVGDTMLFNLLLPGYGIPFVLYLLVSRAAPGSPRPAKRVADGMALLLGFVWATLEVRHGFSGTRLTAVPMSQVELWSYSILYLLGGVTVLLAGLRLARRRLRHVGLAILLLVVAKVFLIDLAELTGIWRAFSFLGLGATLVGVGWMYRRLRPVPVGEER